MRPSRWRWSNRPESKQRLCGRVPKQGLQLQPDQIRLNIVPQTPIAHNVVFRRLMQPDSRRLTHMAPLGAMTAYIRRRSARVHCGLVCSARHRS